MALQQAKWNVATGTPCEFVLLNPGLGGPVEGRDFVRINAGSGDSSSSIRSLERMLANSGPNGPTPLTDRLQEIHQRIRAQHEDLARNGQRVVLVIATDGIPTSAHSAHSSDSHKRQLVEALRRLGYELSVFIVIRLTTDDDSVIDFYNTVDEELELPLEVIDDIQSEAREIQRQGNGWVTYSPLLHKIREGGTFVKLLDLLDERRLTPTEVSVLAQLLLREEHDEPMPRSAQDFCDAIDDAIARAPLVYDPVKRIMCPPIQPWVKLAVNPSVGGRVVQSLRMLVDNVTNPLQGLFFNTCNAGHGLAQAELVF